MGFVQGLNVLKQLFAEGGLEIRTPQQVGIAPGGEDNQPLLARTIIQPDGDVITFVSDAALYEEELWKAHVERITENIRQIRLIRMSPAFSVTFISIVSLGWSAVSRQWDPIIVGAAFALILLTGVIVFIAGMASRGAETAQAGLLARTEDRVRRAFQTPNLPNSILKTASVVMLLGVGILNAVVEMRAGGGSIGVGPFVDFLVHERMIQVGLIVFGLSLVIRGLLWWIFRRLLNIGAG
jgi:hypothetical protein